MCIPFPTPQCSSLPLNQLCSAYINHHSELFNAIYFQVIGQTILLISFFSSFYPSNCLQPLLTNAEKTAKQTRSTMILTSPEQPKLKSENRLRVNRTFLWQIQVFDQIVVSWVQEIENQPKSFWYLVGTNLKTSVRHQQLPQTFKLKFKSSKRNLT